MIRKTSRGYVIYNRRGTKRLSKPYRSRKKAEKRLREIEYYASI